MSPINELMSILPYAYHKHTFCQNYVLNFLCFRIKNYYYSKELIVNYILYKRILTASAKPSKNSSILTNSCAPGVSFFFFLSLQQLSIVLIYVCLHFPSLYLKKKVVFKVLENCAVSFADFKRMIAVKCQIQLYYAVIISSIQ